MTNPKPVETNPVKYMLIVRNDNEAAIVTRLDMTQELIDTFTDWHRTAVEHGRS